jgi:dephospho-CoA kinase
MADGEVDRGSIGEIVFGDREQLAWLEQLLHPRVAREYLEWRDRLAGLTEPPEVCATEVPLLYEVAADERFDAVVLITAPKQLRIARTDVPVEQRSDRLIPDEEKAKRADFVYRNTGSLEDLDEFVSSVLDNLRRWS